MAAVSRRDRGLIAIGIAIVLVALLALAIGLPLGAGRLALRGAQRAARLEQRADSLLEAELESGEPAVLSRPAPGARVLSGLRREARRLLAMPVALPLALSGGLSQLLGNHRAAARRYDELLGVERALGDARGMASALWNLADNHEQSGFPDSAGQCYERSYGLYRLAGDDRRAALALERGGMAHSSAQEPDRAAALLGLALGLHGQRGNAEGQARAQSNVGYAWLVAGEYERALPEYLGALERYRRLEDSAAGEGCVLGNLSLILDMKGEDWFRAQCRESLPDEAGVDELVDDARAAGPGAADVCLDAASWGDEALVQYRAIAESSRVAGDSSSWAMYLGVIASAWQERGELDSAVACLRQALDIQQQLGDRWRAAYEHHQLGVLFRARGEPDSALVHYREALRRYEAEQSEFSRDLVLWELQLLCRSLSEDGFSAACRRIGMPDEETGSLLARIRVMTKPVAKG